MRSVHNALGKSFSIVEKYIEIICYPYLQIIYKKKLNFTARIYENIKLSDRF